MSAPVVPQDGPGASCRGAARSGRSILRGLAARDSPRPTPVRVRAVRGLRWRRGWNYHLAPPRRPNSALRGRTSPATPLRGSPPVRPTRRRRAGSVALAPFDRWRPGMFNPLNRERNPARHDALHHVTGRRWRRFAFARRAAGARSQPRSRPAPSLRGVPPRLQRRLRGSPRFPKRPDRNRSGAPTRSPEGFVPSVRSVSRGTVGPYPGHGCRPRKRAARGTRRRAARPRVLRHRSGARILPS
jgi:hypothetical protein